MKELERQRVCRIAMDHALRVQEAEKPPPATPRSICIKAVAAATATVAATAALAARFLH